MRLFLLGLIVVAIIAFGCTSKTSTASCKTDTQCKSYQFCNQTSGSCATLPGYCDVDSQCTQRDNLTICDSQNTHTCVYANNTCRTNANCQNWQVCDANDMCQPAPGYCNLDSQCTPVFQFCSPSTHQCAPAPGYCSSDTDCEAWQQCDVVSKRCFLLPGRCDLDGDCQNYQSCDVKTHNCVPKVGFCNNDQDCPTYARCDSASKKCVASQGYCLQDNECNSWELCDSQTHQCKPQNDRCDSTADCGSWQVCDSNHDCAAKVGFCNDNTNCVQGEVCNQQTHMCQ